MSPDGTWSDNATSPPNQPILTAPEIDRFWRMRKTVLRYVVSLTVAVIVIAVGGQAVHWISEPFASRLIDMSLPVLLGAITAIVATLFTDSSRK